MSRLSQKKKAEKAPNQERIRKNLTMLMHILATNIAVKMVKEIIKHL